MVLGGGLLQSFVIDKINKMGHIPVCVDKDPDAVAFSKSAHRKNIDIIDQEACLQYAKSLKIDAVITAATDYGVLTASYIAEKMGLCGISYDTAKIIKNKYQIRLRLNDSLHFYEISNTTQLKNISDSIIYPVIVKPCDGSGSKGVAKANDFDELSKLYLSAAEKSLSKKVLIESFVEGKEYGAESIVTDGEIHVLAVMKKTMTIPPVYAELGHSVPCGLSGAAVGRIKEKIKEAIKSLNINCGAVNMDFLLSNGGEVHIIDVGARMGGNLIGSHIVPLSTGIDYMAAIIDTALYNKADLSASGSENRVATRILNLKPGKVKKMPDLSKIKEDKCVHDIVLKISEGCEIKEYISNIEGCGYIVCVGDDINEIEEKAENIKNYIDNSIVRE